MSEQYWASKPQEEIGSELMRRVEDYTEFLKTSGRMDSLRRKYSAFYGRESIESTGAQGELKAINVNHYGSLVRSIHTMVTSQPPAWESRAANTDVKSQAQTILANGLLDYYAREKRMARYTDQALLTALLLDEAWVCTTWDATIGEPVAVDPETGEAVTEGDVTYKLFRMNEVIRDVNRDDGKHVWLMTVEWVNKYDEAAKYPDLAERILALDSEKRDLDASRLRPLWIGASKKKNDLVPRYTFYHDRTPAVPNGRLITFFASDLVVMDSPLPYRRVPLRSVTVEEMIETAFGHSPSTDLLSIQEAIDTLISTVVTNQSTFGVQNVMVPKGSDIGVSQLAGGLNLIEFDSKLGPPAPLNLVQTPGEIFQAITMLVEAQQTISGVNAVARGNASPQLSGAAMALLQATALQFSSAAQKSYNMIVEDIGTDTIHALADFSTSKRVAYIVGKHNRSYLKEFTQDDIGSISRVTVSAANALTKTVAGRTEIANQLLNSGLIKRPEQYMTVIQTGQLEPMFENETSELLLIRQENEDLAEGKAAQVVATDVHDMHIREHKSVLASPEARQDPNIVNATLQHIQEHIMALQSTDPLLLQLTGVQVMPPPPMPPAGPEGAPLPPAGQPGPQPAMPEPAQPPANPITGQEF
ncbi:hypothetical protein UFOVP1351_15 [uncultured Caudovirales phage]|uniref:Portal protein n=1 Tax=uncultured Caudovirales phage TaxID=2100421 RepID=A0A6J5RZB3_9CAUD|nr:hypothetical protein UFOVP1351_15 [uncultured Caudovirales phage]